MWVRLTRSYTNKRKKKFHIGKILNVSRETYKELITKNIAEDSSETENQNAIL